MTRADLLAVLRTSRHRSLRGGGADRLLDKVAQWTVDSGGGRTRGQKDGIHLRSPPSGGCCALRASPSSAGAGPALAGETVCKPSSVPRCDPRGRSSIYDGGCPPTLAADPRAERTHPCRACARRLSYLALLQVELARFTRPTSVARGCRLVSVALVLASRRTGVTRYPASRSSDFPRISNGFRRRDTRPSDHLAGRPILPD